VNETASWVIAIVVAALIVTAAFVIAYRPRVSKDAVAGLLAVFAVAVIAAGIISASEGTRTIEHHEDDHELAPEGAGSEG
jgi:hypothetical protein